MKKIKILVKCKAKDLKQKVKEFTEPSYENKVNSFTS